MENKSCIVVTNPEWGWDCVISVYVDFTEEEAKEDFLFSDEYLLEKYNEEVRAYRLNIFDPDENFDWDKISDEALEHIKFPDRLKENLISEILSDHNYVFHDKDLIYGRNLSC